MQKVSITSGIFGNNFTVVCSKNIFRNFCLSKRTLWMWIFLAMIKSSAFPLSVQI